MRVELVQNVPFFFLERKAFTLCRSSTPEPSETEVKTGPSLSNVATPTLTFLLKQKKQNSCHGSLTKCQARKLKRGVTNVRLEKLGNKRSSFPGANIYKPI
jgi:hypothetical protein